MKSVNKAEFEYLLKLEKGMGGLLLIDFYTTWCQPCKLLMPRLEAIEPGMPEVSFLKVDCEHEPELADKYNVTSVPTLVLLKEGETVVDTKTGLLSEAAIREWLIDCLGK